MPSRVAIYKRVSSQTQVRDGYSLEFQEEIMRAYCQREALTIARVYQDGGRSGSNTEREGLQQLVRDAKAGAFDVVLIFRVDRFSRDPVDLLYLVQELNRRNIRLRSVTEAVDASDPAGELMLTILGAIGKFVRANIIQNAMLGKRKRAEYGRYNGGRVPFGYQVGEDGHFSADTSIWWEELSAAALVKRTYEEFVRISVEEGRGLRGLSRWLNERRVPSPTRRASGWSPSVCRTLIRNPVYTGDYAYAKTKQPMGGNATPRPTSEWVLVPDSHPPLVSRALWQKAQVLLDGNSTRGARPRVDKPLDLLAGFVRCSLCDSSLTARRPGTKTRYVYYTCGSRYNETRLRGKTVCAFPFIRAEDLETAVWQVVTAIAQDEATVERVISGGLENDDHLKTLEKRVDAAKRELERLESAEERLMDSSLRGLFREELVVKKADELAKERAKVQERIADLEHQWNDAIRLKPYLAVDAERVKEYIAQALSDAGRLDVAAKRQVLQALVGHRGIRVGPDGLVEIGLRLPLEVLRTSARVLVNKEVASRRS